MMGIPRAETLNETFYMIFKHCDQMGDDNSLNKCVLKLLIGKNKNYVRGHDLFALHF